jgi:hypothetical protein
MRSREIGAPVDLRCVPEVGHDTQRASDALVVDLHLQLFVEAVLELGLDPGFLARRAIGNSYRYSPDHPWGSSVGLALAVPSSTIVQAHAEKRGDKDHTNTDVRPRYAMLTADRTP